MSYNEKPSRARAHAPAPALDKWNRRCCFNCTHHLAFEYHGEGSETIVCEIFSTKIYTYLNGSKDVGIDYSKRIPANHVPCKHWKIDKRNAPLLKNLLERKEPQQLEIF